MFSKIKIRFQIFNLQLNQSVAFKEFAVVHYGHSFAYALTFINYGVFIADNESYTVLQTFKVLIGIFAADVHHTVSSFLDLCIRSNAEILKLGIGIEIHLPRLADSNFKFGVHNIKRSPIHREVLLCY